MGRKSSLLHAVPGIAIHEENIVFQAFAMQYMQPAVQLCPRTANFTITTRLTGTAACVFWRPTSPSLNVYVVYLPDVSKPAGLREAAHKQTT